MRYYTGTANCNELLQGGQWASHEGALKGGMRWTQVSRWNERQCSSCHAIILTLYANLLVLHFGISCLYFMLAAYLGVEWWQWTPLIWRVPYFCLCVFKLSESLAADTAAAMAQQPIGTSVLYTSALSLPLSLSVHAVWVQEVSPASANPRYGMWQTWEQADILLKGIDPSRDILQQLHAACFILHRPSSLCISHCTEISDRDTERVSWVKLGHARTFPV